MDESSAKHIKPSPAPGAWQNERSKHEKSDNKSAVAAALENEGYLADCDSCLDHPCLAAVPQPQSSPGYIDNNAPKLEGSWLVTVTLDLENGPPPFQTLVSHTAGGVAISSDPSVYPLYPMQTAYHGTWAKKRHRSFAFTMIGFQYDEAISGLWKGIIKETVTLEPGGDAYTGKGTVEWYYPNGDFGGVVGDTTHAIRIKAE